MRTCVEQVMDSIPVTACRGNIFSFRWASMNDSLDLGFDQGSFDGPKESMSAGHLYAWRHVDVMLVHCL